MTGTGTPVRPAGLVRSVDPWLADFAALVGREDPVCPAGGRTQWLVGGAPDPAARLVRAPGGIVSHLPEEMIARVPAGTTLAELAAALAPGGQMVPFDLANPAAATVGGALAVGHSGPRRLRYGPLRDAVLEVTFVTAAGRLVTAGGPVVKNVTGFDLCRLLVGSLGTLGVLAEVVLRCHPIPAASRWFRSGSALLDPIAVLHRLYRPSSVLWDGESVWVLLEGNPDDVEAQAADALGRAFGEVEAGPQVGGVARLSLPPGQLGLLTSAHAGGGWVAELGVGTVHTPEPAELAGALGRAWPAPVDAAVRRLHDELKLRFDPTGRLNPGRRML